MSAPNAEPERWEIVDAETGLVYATHNGPLTSPTFKGWLLRSRTGYMRRTGHKLIVRSAHGDGPGAQA